MACNVGIGYACNQTLLLSCSSIPVTITTPSYRVPFINPVGYPCAISIVNVLNAQIGCDNRCQPPVISLFNKLGERKINIAIFLDFIRLSSDIIQQQDWNGCNPLPTWLALQCDFSHVICRNKCLAISYLSSIEKVHHSRQNRAFAKSYTPVYIQILVHPCICQPFCNRFNDPVRLCLILYFGSRCQHPAAIMQEDVISYTGIIIFQNRLSF